MMKLDHRLTALGTSTIAVGLVILSGSLTATAQQTSEPYTESFETVEPNNE